MRIKMKFIPSILLLSTVGFITTNAVADSGISVPKSNAKDAFVTKGINTIDLGDTITLDAEGYPTKDSIQTIYDEYDYQGAVSAYLQTVSQMTVYGSVKTNRYYGATKGTDVLFMYKDPSIDGMLTPNRKVGYVFSYPNLAETGPLIYEYPAGATAGVVMDVKMRYYIDMGLTSKYGSKGAKYYIYTEGQNLPTDLPSDIEAVKIQTNILFLGFRVLDPVKNPNLHKQLKVYPYAERNNPKANQFFQAKKSDDTYLMTAPIGMKYWQQLHEYIQVEKVEEEDRFMMARLKAVGIEKGKPFQPTERQKRLLEKAALVGEKMAITISFTDRDEKDRARYRADSKWSHPLTMEPSHREDFINQLEERIDWTYEAYGVSPAMKAKLPGKGSTYLGAYQDVKGEWFEGAKTYKMHIEPKVPAARFWDVSVYSLETRVLLPFEAGKVSAINSVGTKGIKTNSDGSVDLFFGPGKAPKGYENNFISTNAGTRWFTYFRLYGPTKTYLERTWKMNDIVEVN